MLRQLPHGRRAFPLTLALALGLMLALLAAPALTQPVRADGGAPNLAYIAGGGTNGHDLVVVDVGQRKVTQHITLPSAPAAVLLSTDNRSAYVTLPASNELAIVDASAHTLAATMAAGPGPRALAQGFVNGTPLLFVADSGGSTVSVIDPAARKVRATIPVGIHPSGIALAVPGSGISDTNPNDEELYVANTDSDSVSVVSTLAQKVIATIPVSGGPLGVVIPGSGGIAYVSTRSGSVVALSLASHRALGTLVHLQGALGAMDYDAVTGQVYVPDPTAGVVDVLRPATDPGPGAAPTLPAEPARTLSFPSEPSAVAITFDGAYGFVAERAAGHVAMFDAAAHTMLATIDVGGAPVGVITGAYPPAVSGQAAFFINMAVVAVILALMVSTLVSIGRMRRGAAAGANGGKGGDKGTGKGGAKDTTGGGKGREARDV